MKVRHPDMRIFFDDHAIATICASAGQSGVAPALRYSDPDRGIMVFDRLGRDWSWGKVDRFADTRILENTVTAKKQLHDGPAFPRSTNVFKIIETYWGMIGAQRVSVPPDVQTIVQTVRNIAGAIAGVGYDEKPSHGDGVASNIMIGPKARIKLVDFDMAANMDPYYDLGSLMVEAFQFADDARQILEIYDGIFVESHYNRCRLYGIADDLMWALWGFICFKLSPRKDVEFTKYAEWRLLRCRWNLGDPDFERWITRL
jgi:thiamine kinase-like enzyme